MTLSTDPVTLATLYAACDADNALIERIWQLEGA